MTVRERLLHVVSRRLPWAGSSAAVLGIGMAVAQAVDPPLGSPSGGLTRLVPYLLAIAGVAAAACGIRIRRSIRQPADKPLLELAEPSGPTPFDELDPTTARHPFIAKLGAVIVDHASKDVRENLLITDVGFDGDHVATFGLRHRRHGGFAKESLRETIFDDVTISMGGVWLTKALPEKNLLVISRKAGFPKAAATPLPAGIPASLNAALDYYRDFRLQLGIRADGTVLEIDLQKFPHAFIVGGTGGGKSVFGRSTVEQLRAAGFMVFLIDGKGTDYTGVNGLANVAAVAAEIADILRILRMLSDELSNRKADARARQRSGASDPFRRPPIFIFVDEWATLRDKIEAEYGSDVLDEVMGYLLFLGRVGREFKMHLFLATQEAYRKIVPGALLGAMQLQISLGPPEKKTIEEVFPEKMRREAARVGGTLSKNNPGRCLILTMSEDGTNEVIEFQSFFGYSPADPKPTERPALLHEEHERYRIEVSERVQKLYPRMWFRMENSDYRKPSEYEELYTLPAVALDQPDGQPDPRFTKYDPQHDDYLGDAVDTAGAPIPSLGELTPEHIYARTVAPRVSTTITGLEDDADQDDTDPDMLDDDDDAQMAALPVRSGSVDPAVDDQPANDPPRRRPPPGGGHYRC